MYNFFYDYSVKLRKSKTGKIVYDLLEIAGVRIIISRFFNKRHVLIDEKNPNERILNSRAYFRCDENLLRIKNVEQMFFDEESRMVYKAMIKFRCTSKYSDLPYNSMRKQYFVNDFFDYSLERIRGGVSYVDCGAYDGDSILLFKKYMKKNKVSIKSIVAFEADKENVCLLRRNHPDVLVIDKGVWNQDTKLSFNGGKHSGSSLCVGQGLNSSNNENNNVEEIEVCTIDNCQACNDVSFLKMDIEGAEINALEGAKKTILRNKPKLAICIYHSDEDMIRIAEWIHQLVPEYKLYVRQHSNCFCETVLYATM